MILQNFIKAIVDEIIRELPKDKVQKILDNALDKVEDYVQKTPNKIDDHIVLPLIKKLVRDPFGIEDND